MKKICVSMMAAGIVLLAATTSHALILSSGISTNGIGSFTGTFDYSYEDSTTGEIIISLTNTTPAYGGYLTAFAFNNPVDNIVDLNDRITGVSAFVSTDIGDDFDLIDAPFSTGDTFDANPFGTFDLGAASTDDWLGGGGPGGGLAIGESATFTFSLTGVGLDTLTSESFFSDLALSSGNTGDYGPQNFAVRFRGLAEPPTAGSDKVIGVPSGAVPEPMTMVLFGSGMAGAFLRRKFQA